MSPNSCITSGPVPHAPAQPFRTSCPLSIFHVSFVPYDQYHTEMLTDLCVLLTKPSCASTRAIRNMVLSATGTTVWDVGGSRTGVVHHGHGFRELEEPQILLRPMSVTERCSGKEIKVPRWNESEKCWCEHWYVSLFTQDLSETWTCRCAWELSERGVQRTAFPKCVWPQDPS